MTAIPLTAEEKAIAEGQCQRCFFWDWYEGCGYLLPIPGRVYPNPYPDCGAFEEVKK